MQICMCVRTFKPIIFPSHVGSFGGVKQRIKRDKDEQITLFKERKCTNRSGLKCSISITFNLDVLVARNAVAANGVEGVKAKKKN